MRHLFFPYTPTDESLLSAGLRQTRRRYRSWLRRVLASAAVVVAVSPGSGLAAKITVNSTVDVLADDGECTLREAVIAANTNRASGKLAGECTAGDAKLQDQIVFQDLKGKPDIYLLKITGTNEDGAATGDLDLTESVRLIGNGAAKTIIDGDQRDRVLDIHNQATVEIEALTVRNGSVSGHGGGIRNGDSPTPGGSVAIEASVLSGNTAARGGGVYCVTFDNSQVRVRNSTFSGNTAYDRGGGVYSHSIHNSQVRVSNSTLSENTAVLGGGVNSITHGSSQLTVSNSTLSGNRASIGGGVYSDTFGSSQVRVSNSTLSGNTVYNKGGGVYSHTLHNGQVTVKNSTLSGNRARIGGGISSRTYGTSQVTVKNSTLSDNTADEDGGGISSRTYDSSQVTLARTLISGNTASTGAEVSRHVDGGGTFIADNFNFFGHSGLTTVQAFSNFVPGASDLTASSDGTTPTTLLDILDPTLQDNDGHTATYALMFISPAHDASPVDADCPATDQRGVIRPQGAACDIGAFERQGTLDPCTEAGGPTSGCTVDGVPNQACLAPSDSGHTIVGTSEPDIIVGGEGNDVLEGQDGDDTLCGVGGDDTLEGNRGADLLIGGDGVDILAGNQDEDELRGGTGPDTLDGGGEADILIGGEGEDHLLGGPGEDWLRGGADNDILEGGRQDDLLEGNGGDDELFGGREDDVLDGGAGRDLLDGEGGTDTCLTDGTDPLPLDCEA